MSRRYGPANIPWEFEAEHGLFQLNLSKTSKDNPAVRPHKGREEAANPVSSEHKLRERCVQLGPPRFPGILTPWGRHVGSRCKRVGNLAFLGGRPG